MPRPAKRRANGRPALPDGPVLPGCILAIDIGSRRCGWAWAKLDADGKVTGRESGVLRLDDVRVTWLAVEEPHTQKDNVGTRHLMHGLYTLADVFSGRTWERPVHPISRIDVFKATVGWCMRPLDDAELAIWQQRNGTRKRTSTRRPMRAPTKAEMMAAVNARHAGPDWRNITSEDEADAIAALDMVLAGIAGTAPITVEVPAGLGVKRKRVPSAARLPLFAAVRQVKARGRKREAGA
jgi:hypothetical protein